VLCLCAYMCLTERACAQRRVGIQERKAAAFAPFAVKACKRLQAAKFDAGVGSLLANLRSAVHGCTKVCSKEDGLRH
jgi:hypothetical protein